MGKMISPSVSDSIDTESEVVESDVVEWTEDVSDVVESDDME